VDDVNIEFNPAAFKHGVTEADIRWAFDTARYDGMIDESEEYPKTNIYSSVLTATRIRWK